MRPREAVCNVRAGSEPAPRNAPAICASGRGRLPAAWRGARCRFGIGAKSDTRQLHAASACYRAPMPYFLDGISSLRCWRDPALSALLARDRPRLPARVSPAESTDAVLGELLRSPAASLLASDEPVGILVPRGTRRMRGSWFASGWFEEGVPAHSYRRLSPGVCALSPEMCFMQLARVLAFPRLVELGCELCGTYGLFGDGFERMGRDALTSARRLKGVIEAHRGSHGTKKAREAARFVLDGSNSPGETKTYLVLCLPSRYGGYGLEKPEFNAVVEAKPMAGRLVGKRFYRCDLLWRAASVAIEYEGVAHHAGAKAIDADSKRRAALLELGVLVVTVTGGQLANVSEMERIARAMGRRLGVRDQRDRFALTSERRDLHRELFRTPRRY